MAITRGLIVNALNEERSINQKGAPFDVLSSEWNDSYIVIEIKAAKARNKVPLDEGLEGARVRWGQDLEFGGLIKIVDADRDRIVVQPLTGSPPAQGITLWIYLQDFLGPLIDMWNGPMAALAARRLKQTKTDPNPLNPIKPLPPVFADLRQRQALAVQCTAYRCSIMIGPPGTGKSYTIGAMVAYLLTRFPNARVLVTGPTNVAVDTAILAIDDWLQSIQRPDLAKTVKRIGAHFDPRKYESRPHLLADGIADRVNEFLLLQASEPTKTSIADYVKWKNQIAALRAALGADISSTAATAKVVGVTVATAVRWHDALRANRFPFVLCDEASQVLGPAAMMVAALGDRAIFAGDPQQLSPIVRSNGAAGRSILGKTAFDVFKHVQTTRLNEQSRMTDRICAAVGATFYHGDLTVCTKANSDQEWRRERSPFFINGREVPRICFDRIDQPATYSQKYGGFIRFKSAELVLKALDELAGSYVDPCEIVVLTPYRAQVSLLRSMLRNKHPHVPVSTVHRAQGSERTLVIFDPVDASSSFFEGQEGNRLINVAISRAKAHVIIPYHPDDLKNPAMKSIHAMSRQSDNFPRPFTFQ